MVRTREWKYVHDPMGDRDELYDLVADPNELVNVVDEEQHRDALAAMRLRLADWSINTEDGQPVPFPTAPTTSWRNGSCTIDTLPVFFINRCRAVHLRVRP